MPTIGSEVGAYAMRRQVDDPFCTKATKSISFEYQGYTPKPWKGGYSVIRDPGSGAQCFGSVNVFTFIVCQDEICHKWN
jgi:hypothetical protein